MTLGEFLREAREERGMSIARAAKTLEVAKLTYSMWERDAWIVGRDKVERLAEFTNRDPYEIRVLMGDLTPDEVEILLRAKSGALQLGRS
jgi:transcriptional regulator with XRE-family HTH domain